MKTCLKKSLELFFSRARLCLNKAFALVWNSPASGSGEFVGFGPVPGPFTNKRPLTSVLQTSIKDLSVLLSVQLTCRSSRQLAESHSWGSFAFLSFYSLTVAEFLLYPSVYKSPVSRVCSSAWLWGLHLFSAGPGRKHLFSCLNNKYRVPVLLGPLSACGHRHVR